MKIGFDISQTGPAKAGCGYFASNLIAHLTQVDHSNQYALLPTFGDHFWDKNYKKTFKTPLANFQREFHHRSLSQAQTFWRGNSDAIEKQFSGLDILHCNNFFCPPKLKTPRLVYTLYDLSFIEYPDCMTEHNRIASFDGVFKASLNADLILAISEYTREHFLKTFPYFPAERIKILHPASRFTNATQIIQPSKFNFLTTKQFWLNVGTIEPRKNIKRLLSVYAKLKKQNPDTYPLVLAGKQGWMEKIDLVINELGISKDVHVLGYVSDEELQWLYQNCFCLVYPSLFEGFGLPVLEAMTLGAPVISSKISSIPEITGNSALLIQPQEENELLYAMQIMSSDQSLREKLIKEGSEQAMQFSWQKSANLLLNFYQEVLSLPHRDSDSL